MQIMVFVAHKIMLKNYILQNVHHEIIQKADNLLQELLLAIFHCCQ